MSETEVESHLENTNSAKKEFLVSSEQLTIKETADLKPKLRKLSNSDDTSINKKTKIKKKESKNVGEASKGNNDDNKSSKCSELQVNWPCGH